MRIIFILILFFVFSACGSGNKSDDQAFIESLESGDKKTAIDEELISGILQQIPSPLEISLMLKESGNKYNSDFLNSPDNYGKYNTNYKKALNLGVYGTDLGYTNIYEKNADGIKYLSKIKSMADELNIGQYFDIQTIGRLAANSRNLDSLLMMTTKNFNTINSYLQTQGRSNLSVLLLTGGWVEAMNIVCNVASMGVDHPELRETIGEQKIVLEQIILLFSFFQDSDENMASLLKDLKELETAFKEVNITYTYKESSVEIVNGVAVVKDNSTTTITITKQDIENIKNVTGSIRTKIIS
ncbi:MAG: hypothetical protein HC811_04300 [Flammeovirgaceae bacterium]|nr:hypothetical protein [Flammeovirgaceae bacterium]